MTAIESVRKLEARIAELSVTIGGLAAARDRNADIARSALEERDAALARAQRAEAALREYGWHKDDCWAYPQQRHGFSDDPGYTCLCGFRDAVQSCLQEVEKAKDTERQCQSGASRAFYQGKISGLSLAIRALNDRSEP